MEQKFYSNIDMKRFKFFARDKFGVKRLLKAKKLPDRTLILLNFQYARHLGYLNLEALYKAQGIEDKQTPLYHDIDNNKLYAIVKDNLVQMIKNDPSFRVVSVFAPHTKS
jgi:hypothetical protein